MKHLLNKIEEARQKAEEEKKSIAQDRVFIQGMEKLWNHHVITATMDTLGIPFTKFGVLPADDNKHVRVSVPDLKVILIFNMQHTSVNLFKNAYQSISLINFKQQTGLAGFVEFSVMPDMPLINAAYDDYCKRWATAIQTNGLHYSDSPTQRYDAPFSIHSRTQAGVNADTMHVPITLVMDSEINPLSYLTPRDGSTIRNFVAAEGQLNDDAVSNLVDHIYRIQEWVKAQENVATFMRENPVPDVTDNASDTPQPERREDGHVLALVAEAYENYQALIISRDDFDDKLREILTEAYLI